MCPVEVPVLHGRITKLFTGIALLASCSSGGSGGLSRRVIFKSFIRENETVRLLERCKIFYQFKPYILLILVNIILRKTTPVDGTRKEFP
jgi:hypothetical protein